MEPLAAIVGAMAVGAVPAPGGGWVIRVPCAKRGEIAVHVGAVERTVTLRAFLIRRADRAHVDVYRRLLRKNLQTRHWRFALDDVADVYLVAEAELDGLDADRLDGLLGELSGLVDEVYEGLLRTGFDVPDSITVGPPPDG